MILRADPAPGRAADRALSQSRLFRPHVEMELFGASLEGIDPDSRLDQLGSDRTVRGKRLAKVTRMAAKQKALAVLPKCHLARTANSPSSSDGLQTFREFV